MEESLTRARRIIAMYEKEVCPALPTPTLRSARTLMELMELELVMVSRFVK